MYDPAKEIWCREDDPGVRFFFDKGGELLAVTDNGESSEVILWNGNGASGSCITYFSEYGEVRQEGNVGWSYESAEIPMKVKKGMSPSRIFLRVRLSGGAFLRAGCVYNGKGTPDRYVTVSDRTDGYFEIPCLVAKGDPVRIAVSGRGEVEILGYAVEYSSDNG